MVIVARCLFEKFRRGAVKDVDDDGAAIRLSSYKKRSGILWLLEQNGLVPIHFLARICAVMAKRCCFFSDAYYSLRVALKNARRRDAENITFCK